MEQYYIWLDNSWVPVETSMALDKLGAKHASFTPIEVFFFDLLTIDPDLSGAHQFVAFIVNQFGDRLYSSKSCVIKHDLDTPHFNYLINPSDFYNMQKTMALERGLGNPVAYEIGNQNILGS